MKKKRNEARRNKSVTHEFVDSKVIFDLSDSVFLVLRSRPSCVSRRKEIFGISLKCVEVKTRFFAQKQRLARRNEKPKRDGNCEETSYRFIEFYSNAKWLTFEYHRRKPRSTGRVKEVLAETAKLCQVLSVRREKNISQSSQHLTERFLKYFFSDISLFASTNESMDALDNDASP